MCPAPQLCSTEVQPKPPTPDLEGTNATPWRTQDTCRQCGWELEQATISTSASLEDLRVLPEAPGTLLGPKSP